MTISQDKKNAIASYLDFVRGDAYPPLAPLELFIEISNLCNMQCAMCPTFSAINTNRVYSIKEKARGFFDLESCMERLSTILPHVLYVHTYGYGEPTIHPQFQELIDYLSQFRVMIDFITNGMRLTREMCDFLVRKKVAKVTVSFSGSNQKDYENIYVGGKFDTVLKNIQYLNEAKKRADSPYPYITVNSIGFRHHINELHRFVDLMADHGVQLIEVKKLVESIHHLRGHAAPYRPEVEGRVVAHAKDRAKARRILLSAEQYENASTPGSVSEPSIKIEDITDLAQHIALSQNSKNIRKVESMDLLSLDIDREFEIELNLMPLNKENFGADSMFYCMEPYKTMYIRQNGFVKPCCFAPDTLAGLGNIHTRSGTDIWLGKAFSMIRKGIASGQYPKALCEACIRQGVGYKKNPIQDLLKNYIRWYRSCFGENLKKESVADSIYSTFPFLRAKLDYVSPEKLVQNLKKKQAGRLTIRALAPLKLEEAIQIVRQRKETGISLGNIISGYLDRISQDEIIGWVYCPHIPDFHGTIIVRHPETMQKIARVKADLYRKDLEAAGIGNGSYGFRIPLPAGWDKVSDASPEMLQITIEELGISMSEL